MASDQIPLRLSGLSKESLTIEQRANLLTQRALSKDSKNSRIPKTKRVSGPFPGQFSKVRYRYTAPSPDSKLKSNPNPNSPSKHFQSDNGMRLKIPNARADIGSGVHANPVNQPPHTPGHPVTSGVKTTEIDNPIPVGEGTSNPSFEGERNLVPAMTTHGAPVCVTLQGNGAFPHIHRAVPVAQTSEKHIKLTI